MLYVVKSDLQRYGCLFIGTRCTGLPSRQKKVNYCQAKLLIKLMFYNSYDS